MKAEKKEILEKEMAYKQVLEKNKKMNRINLGILALGLLLTALGIEIGRYILWAGIFVFFVTAVSSIIASKSRRRLK
ncbi:hypothetical protein MSMTP_0093 [Methanosarcina sp. MTP4]|uniref:hypothetical protein n=1 Tax=Methanosarcina sp. MTP4 TaxID=1434100 RepID=UPI00061617C5|nr:hypothetical protein [Methanosarcina sp. MTP4]AKB23562.1 hypothetical protein MSMTP_0093 [Methanosarcina sp. MTP4]